MTRRGQITTLEERVTIAEWIRAGRSSLEIAEILWRPLATVRKWGSSIGGKVERGYPARWLDQRMER